MKARYVFKGRHESFYKFLVLDPCYSGPMWWFPTIREFWGV